MQRCGRAGGSARCLSGQLCGFSSDSREACTGEGAGGLHQRRSRLGAEHAPQTCCLVHNLHGRPPLAARLLALADPSTGTMARNGCGLDQAFTATWLACLQTG